jgi:hypothetical protein
MGGARALIASLGASISLVAGAALSLLVVSFVFAYQGFTSDVSLHGSESALVLGSPTVSAPSRRAAGQAGRPVVIRATPAPPARATRPAVRKPAPYRQGSLLSPSTFDPGVRDYRPNTPPPAAAPVARKPTTGDGVRDVGDAVSATVEGTGKSTAPLLGPPVSQAVQDVLDLLTAALQGATGTLGSVLDHTVPPR